MKYGITLLMAVLLFGCSKQDAGLLRVETSSIENQTGSFSMWVCELDGNNRTNFQQIDTIGQILVVETNTYQGQTWEVSIGGANLSKPVSAQIYFEGELIGYATTSNTGTVAYRITID